MAQCWRYIGLGMLTAELLQCGFAFVDFRLQPLFLRGLAFQLSLQSASELVRLRLF